MVKAHTLQRKCKLCFELLENSVLRLHKGQYKKQHCGSVGHKTCRCATKNPEQVIFWNGKQTNCKYVWKYLWYFEFLYAENSGTQNTPKSYEVNNSAGLSKVIPSEPWLTGPQKAKSSSDNPGPVDKNNGIYCIYDDSKKMDSIRKILTHEMHSKKWSWETADLDKWS